jgi:hypothetical protein
MDRDQIWDEVTCVLTGGGIDVVFHYPTVDALADLIAQREQAAEARGREHYAELYEAAKAWANMRTGKAAAVKPKPESARLLAAIATLNQEGDTHNG